MVIIFKNVNIIVVIIIIVISKKINVAFSPKTAKTCNTHKKE